MPFRIVQSKQNSRVKELRAALLRPGRGNGGATAQVALEGVNLLAEAIRSGIRLETVFVAQGDEELLLTLGIPDGVEILALPPEVLASAVTTESPQPVAALVEPRVWNWNDVTAGSKLAGPALVVVLAGIQDPGNLGTILRSADAFGATGVISLPGTVSQWNPKALRASAGSAFRLPLLAVSAEESFVHLAEAGIPTLAAMAHDARPLGEHDLAGPVALFIGSEGSGLAPELAARCVGRITIPCPGPVESLNAAVAASVLLYEAGRQRKPQQRGRVR